MTSRKKSFISMGYTHLRMIFKSRPIASFPSDQMKPSQKFKGLRAFNIHDGSRRGEFNLFHEFCQPKFCPETAFKTRDFQSNLFYFPTLLVLNRANSYGMS